MIVVVTDRPYDNSHLAVAYHPGNSMPPSSLQAWTRLIASFSPVTQPVLIDVGTGTGMFAAALARSGDVARTVGIDPSVAMLREAMQRSWHPGVQYIAGDAAALPVADARFDLALLSRVIHHLPDRRRCVRELQRALRPGGVVVVRTTVRERLDAIVYDYWPSLRQTDAARFPALCDLVTEFSSAGFTTLAVRSFAQPVQPSLRSYYDVVALRPQSKFNHVSDVDFAEGLALLRIDADAELAPVAVPERYDVLAFAKA